MKNLIKIIVLVAITTLFIVFIPTNPSNELLSKIPYELNKHHDHFNNPDYAILIDYNKGIFKKRLWVIALPSYEVVLNSHVSHAGKSGLIWPYVFSNKPGSNTSSIGTFKTLYTYESKHGIGEYKIGMRLQGLDHGINDNVLDRNIVFHCSKGFWSNGCFMTSPKTNKKIIDLTKNGSIMIVSYSE